MLGLLPILLVLIIVISIPLLIIWLVKEQNRKRAWNQAKQLPDDVKRLLKTPAGYTEITMWERMRHSIRVFLIGMAVYFIITLLGIMKNAVSGTAFDLKEYLLCSLVIFAFVIVFVLKDLLKVAPWHEVYRIKAVPCLSIHGSGGGTYVCYYDFIREELVVDVLPDTSFLSSKRTLPEQGIDILVAAKCNRLKLIDMIK